MVGRFGLLLSLCLALSSLLSTSAIASSGPQQPDIVFREWDIASFAVDPTAPVFYYVDEADNAIRAFSMEAGERLPYSWSFTDRFHSLTVDYRSRVCVLLQSNSTFYIQQLDEQLQPHKNLTLDPSTPRPGEARPLQLLADYTNQLWLGFYASSIDVYAIDSNSGIGRSHLTLNLASASHYVWALDASLNLWLQQCDQAQMTYSYSSSGTATSTLNLNHTTAWISSMAVSASGALIFAYSNDETLVSFNSTGQRLPRAEWVDAFEDDVLTDLAWDADGHLLARAVSGESVLMVSLNGRELLRVWQSSVVSFVRAHSLQYDGMSGDLFVFGSTVTQGYSALYRLTASNGGLVQQYTQLPARLRDCTVQQVQLSNRGNLWHLLLCNGGVHVLYVTDRSGRVQRQLRLGNDRSYFTIYLQRIAVDDDRQLIYIPYYNSSSKASVLNVYAFNLTLVDSLPTPFSFTSLLTLEMSLNTRNSTVYFLTTTSNLVNCTLYAMSLGAPATSEQLFTIQVADYANQRGQYHMTYTPDDWRTARVLISVHTAGAEGGVYEYDEAQQVVAQYGWDGGLIDHIVAGSDGRLYGFSADRRRIVSWGMGGRSAQQQAEVAQLETAGRKQATVSVAS